MWYSPLARCLGLADLSRADARRRSRARTAASVRAARTPPCDAGALTLPDSIQLGDGLRTDRAAGRSRTRRHSGSSAARWRPRRASAPRCASPTARRQDGARADDHSSGPIGSAGRRHRDPQRADLTELLAHEFEHLIEQLDGVDLKALARDGEARRLADGAFETDRAMAAGQQVAGEVIENAPDRMLKAGASVWRALRRALPGTRARDRSADL